MRRLLRQVYFFYLVAMFFGLMGLYFPLFWFLIRKPKYHLACHATRRHAMRLYMKLTGITYSVEYEGEVDFGRSYVICANHCSFLDVIVMLAAIPTFFRVLAKSNLKRVPVIAYFVRHFDILIDQESRSSSSKAYVRAARSVKGGSSILIFPEGGVEPTPDHLREIKKGAFLVAWREKVPVLPVTILGSWAVLPSDRLEAWPGRVRVIVHKPVENDGLTDLDQLKSIVQEAVEAPLVAASAR
ncbi:MAG: lysophospholipid acyltransferase family protein [Alphaproteobacteria bacterium]